ncbi:maleylacetoacetate isomerase [Fennellomyces sp. T-0311]|nr:maleylacetoacetate isomerase [Fennellomyces sp. T-0311]
MDNYQKPILYGCALSSAAWRVRCILAWKGIEYESRVVNPSKYEHRKEDYIKLNPSRRIPVFVTSDGRVLSQSLAILEYIEEVYPNRPCLPDDPIQRALIREICNEIACDIHPIQNSSFVEQIVGEDRGELEGFARRYITRGFDALEAKLRETKENDFPGRYCVGDDVTIADFFLVPQFYNAVLYKVDLSRYPIIGSIHCHLIAHPEFNSTAPESQCDYEPPNLK